MVYESVTDFIAVLFVNIIMLLKVPIISFLLSIAGFGLLIYGIFKIFGGRSFI